MFSNSSNTTCGSTSCDLSSTAWRAWNTTGSAPTGLPDLIWHSWNDATSTCTSAVSTAMLAWRAWNIATGTVSTSFPPPPATAEELKVRRARQAAEQLEYDKKERERKAQREVAQQKAEILLLEHLDASQRENYKKEKRFRVVTRSGAIYVLKKGWAGNVERVEAAEGQEKPTTRYCIHPTLYIPEEDNLLAQKLLLEADEAEFLRIANATRLAA